MAGLLQLEAWYQANTRPNKCAILTNYKELYRLAQASGISVQAPLNNRSTKAELTAAVHELLDKLNAATQANAGLGPSAVVASTAAMQSASNSSGAAMRAITPLETSGSVASISGTLPTPSSEPTLQPASTTSLSSTTTPSSEPTLQPATQSPSTTSLSSTTPGSRLTTSLSATSRIGPNPATASVTPAALVASTARSLATASTAAPIVVTATSSGQLQADHPMPMLPLQTRQPGDGVMQPSLSQQQSSLSQQQSSLSQQQSFLPQHQHADRELVEQQMQPAAKRSKTDERNRLLDAAKLRECFPGAEREPIVQRILDHPLGRNVHTRIKGRHKGLLPIIRCSCCYTDHSGKQLQCSPVASVKGMIDILEACPGVLCKRFSKAHKDDGDPSKVHGYASPIYPCGNLDCSKCAFDNHVSACKHCLKKGKHHLRYTAVQNPCPYCKQTPPPGRATRRKLKEAPTQLASNQPTTNHLTISRSATKQPASMQQQPTGAILPSSGQPQPVPDAVPAKTTRAWRYKQMIDAIKLARQMANELKLPFLAANGIPPHPDRRLVVESYTLCRSAACTAKHYHTWASETAAPDIVHAVDDITGSVSMDVVPGDLPSKHVGYHLANLEKQPHTWPASS
eukprot:TRINITY_DN12427_c0_g1_i15.p1 TRINITY_DN12427_c0_g1~~TRINITY_DN12427_c0_g1_i15.p1  ORF type:complete len:627 (+),score=112.28 TRINITY_DN12427_c0_g1_i15:1235-3115(+)